MGILDHFYPIQLLSPFYSPFHKRRSLICRQHMHFSAVAQAPSCRRHTSSSIYPRQRPSAFGLTGFIIHRLLWVLGRTKLYSLNYPQIRITEFRNKELSLYTTVQCKTHIHAVLPVIVQPRAIQWVTMHVLALLTATFNLSKK